MMYLYLDGQKNRMLSKLKPLHYLWWRFVPGITVTVRWPNGYVVIDEDGQGGQTSVLSSDPNDHYRPWLEQNVGRQHWDWDWGFRADNVTLNTLTIKFRRGRAEFASHAALRWS